MTLVVTAKYTHTQTRSVYEIKVERQPITKAPQLERMPSTR